MLGRMELLQNAAQRTFYIILLRIVLLIWKCFHREKVLDNSGEMEPLSSRFGTWGMVQLNLLVACKDFNFCFDGALFYEYTYIYTAFLIHCL